MKVLKAHRKCFVPRKFSPKLALLTVFWNRPVDMPISEMEISTAGATSPDPVPSTKVSLMTGDGQECKCRLWCELL
jgi:hypothetical protein